MRAWTALGLAAGLAACHPAAPQLDPQARPYAHAFFNEVRDGLDIDADPHVAHELKNPTSEAELAEFRALIPADPPQSIETRDVGVTSDQVGVTTKLAEVYHYPDRALLVQTALFKSPAGSSPVIVGFQVQPAQGG